MTSYISQSWNGSVWVNTYQFINTFNANNIQTSLLYQQWDGSAWINYSYFANNYDANSFHEYNSNVNFDSTGNIVISGDSTQYYFHTATVGINKATLQNKDITIYPIPAHNTFTISLNNQSSINNSQLTIFDVTGRVVHEQKIYSQLSTVNCQLSAGVYFVKVEAGEKMYEQKLVVE
jgi:hypothetical protein